ncbi:tetratricopeptide repeat protein [Salegentibacter sp. HM20]
MRIQAFIILFFMALGSLSAQSEDLAKRFFDRGEYEKALKLYEDLAAKNPANPVFFFGMVNSLQQMENFSEAEVLLRERLDNSANNPTLLIELGHNYELQQKKDRAEEYYREALNAVDARPNFAFSIARAFEKYSLLDFAAETYEKGMSLKPDQNFHHQLARIYGEQGKTEQMFENYLELIASNPNFFNIVNREFGRYITEDPGGEANEIFRKLLIKKMQAAPQEVLYNEMLSWLYIQQREFSKAFSQEKALYRRGETGLENLLNLAGLARSSGDANAAREIIAFIIEETPSENLILQGRRFILNLDAETARASEFNKIETDYRELLSTYGYDLNTLEVQLDFSNFLAFKLGKKEEAIKMLKELSEKTNSDASKARVKMALADILVFEEKFNEALIYYSQVQNLVKNQELAQNARFKVAKTSYFKGDFEWAKTQLDVLKSSTSQLIANDAMELSLLIQDNSIEDSTQTALKQYARADLLAFQQKNSEAIKLLSEILEQHKGEKIEDEALLKQAGLLEKEGEFQKAADNYLKIIELYPKEILTDNAHFYLAGLYADELNEPEKAKIHYEQIIFNFADSIYYVDARNRFRALRGDELN